MFSNYSHDHIALDTMNIMANGQYIDRIMTKIQNLTSRQATLSVNSAMLIIKSIIIDVMDNNVDTNNIDIDTIDINIDVSNNDTKNIDIHFQ